jgi:hypothetical protein
MNRIAWKLALAVGLAAGVVTTSAADDEKKGDKTDKPAKPADKAPDWSKYATAGEVTGAVVSADEDGVTVRLSGLARTGGGRRGGQVKETHVDHTYKFADGGLARWKKLPAKVGADGKKTPHTSAELEKAKLPTGAPGYAAERSDLTSKVVELHLVRPKSVPASKATPDDLVVKYAVIVGDAPNVPKPDKK